MKKVVNSALASALALSVLPAVVSAEEQAPKMDAHLEKTVKRLEALGLVQGYGNGDYGVERNITRAEFATLLVRVKNMEQAAALAKFQSNFKDVNASDWFAGYVNVAFTDELVKGYTDQTFKPNNNVTYAEAAAMIVRALGYEPAVKGAWPNNYIAMAAQLGISNGVMMDANKPAVRGDIFKMLDNSLNIDMLEQVSFGSNVEYKPAKDVTLLTRYLDVMVYDMDWADEDGREFDDLPFVSNVPVVGLGTLEGNEVEFRSSKSLKGKYRVSEYIDPNAFAGQHVQVWVKDGVTDDVVVWMEGAADEEVINDKIGDFYFDGKLAKSSDISDESDLEDLTLELGNGKKYDFSEDVRVVVNFDTNLDPVDALKDLIDNYDAYTVKVVLNENDEIVYLSVIDDVTADQDSDSKFGSEVLEKVDVNKQYLHILQGDKSKVELEGDEGEDFLVFLNGKPAKLADLQPMDVFSIYYANGDEDKKLVFAVRNVVEGKVDQVRTLKDNDNRIKIGDKEYRFRSASYSENNNEDIYDVISKDQIRDLEGVEVKLFLDATGRVRHIQTQENVEDRRFRAILTRDVHWDGDNYVFSVLDEKGTERTIRIDEIEDENGDELGHTTVLNSLKLSADNKVIFFEIELDSKGDVDTVTLIDGDKLEMISGDNWEVAADEDDLVFEVGGETYEVENSTVFVTGDVSDDARAELDDADTVSFKSVADEDDLTVYYLVEDGEVEYFFVTEGEVIEGDEQYGYVKHFSKRGGEDYVTILTKDGSDFKEVEYMMDSSVSTALKTFQPKDFILFSVDGNELEVDSVVPIVDTAEGDQEKVRIEEGLDLAEAQLDDIVAAKVVDVDGNSLTVETKDGEIEVAVGSGTEYFNVDGDVVSDVEEGDYVLLIETDDDGKRFDYVLVVATADEVEDDEALEEAMEDFIAQEDVDPNPNPEPGELTLSDLSAVEQVLLPGIISNYVVSGTVSDADATVTVTLDGEAVEATVEADGSFTVTFANKRAGLTEATVEAVVDGETATETVNVQ